MLPGSTCMFSMMFIVKDLALVVEVIRYELMRTIVYWAEGELTDVALEHVLEQLKAVLTLLEELNDELTRGRNHEKKEEE